jgi:hypothetical protein
MQIISKGDLVERSALYKCTTDRLGWDGMECVGK